ncbi:MAG: amidohydrolase family protein [Selenomonadaceae bacterium]|nr:amidohydrolase family protein [Selenomonadaceae bacterium]
MEVIDSHVHIGLNKFFKTKNDFPYNLENDFHDYLNLFRTSKFSKACILPIPDQDVDKIESHEYLKEATDYSNGQFLPICGIDESLANNICGDFVGCKLHRVYDDIPISKLQIALKILEYYHVPLIIHAAFKNKVQQIRALLKIAPKLVIILAHMGRGHIYTSEGVLENLKALESNSNVYFETSTVGNSETIEKACDIIGSERIMFGSDYPFGKIFSGKSYNYVEELDVVLNARITDSQKRDVLYGTANHVFQCSRYSDFVTQYQSRYESDMKNLLQNLTSQNRKFLALDEKHKIIQTCMKQCKHIFAIIHDGKFAGFMRESGRPNGTSLLEELVISPEYRGIGLSRLAIKFFKHIFPHHFAKSNSQNFAINHVLESEGYIRDDGKRIFHWEYQRKENV